MKTVGLHLHRRDSAREVAGQRDAVLDQADDFVRIRGFRERPGGEFLLQHLPGQRRARQVLAKAVVQVVPDAALLALADFHDHFFEPFTLGHFLGQRCRALADAILQLAVEGSQTG